ncbi:MAG: tRNA-specific 2-thiouridylase [Rikenellaceae bacterium]
MGKEILLAFSGGIDSCAAVGILRDWGYSVHLLTIDMLGDEALMSQARESAARLGLQLHTLDARQLFEREIVSNFVEEYANGRTPAPCTRCNPLIKWRLLAQEAERLGIYHIATGHYFRLVEYHNHLYVSRARDLRKDQSYYLWGVGESILRRVVTPMGERIKEEVKAASTLKRESMGVCFLRGSHYTELLRERCGAGSRALAEGDVVDGSGGVVGRHSGVARYTIGQRRGDGIPEGLRVTAIDASKNLLRVGLNEELYTDRLEIVECHFIEAEELFASNEVRVMIRGIGRNPEGYAVVRPTPYGAEVELLDCSAWAAAPGQPVALYIGDRVVGGGVLR